MILSLSVGLAVFIILILLFLAAENISRTDDEQKLVNATLTLLNKKQYDDVTLDTLDRRAEVGANAGQLRTLFPILAIPVAILLLSEYIGNLSNNSILIYLIIFLPVLAFSLLREIDRANADVIIRHAIAEYREIQQRRLLIEQQDISRAALLLKHYSHDSRSNRSPNDKP